MLINKPTGIYYKIENIQQLPAFFINVVSASDVWMFLSSNGAPAAGRQNMHASVFPYETDDRLHLSTATGPKTLVRMGDRRVWEPFNTGFDNPYDIARSLYKRVTGDAVMFEEINHTLGLAFCYRWETSEKYGLVRTAEIKNISGETIAFEMLDGVENLIPHGIQPSMAANTSCLTDAYKAAERPDNGRLAVYSLTMTIGDTLEPVEILRANICWHVGTASTYLLSSRQISDFAFGKAVENEVRTAGRKGAFLLHQALELPPGGAEQWQLVIDARKSQREVAALLKEVNGTPIETLRANLEADIQRGTDELVRIVAAADGLHQSGDENGAIRHYMNVLYNNMRGGVFLNGYGFDAELFANFVSIRDKGLAKRRADFLEKARGAADITALHRMAYEDGDPDIFRLSMEFLPLTFSRRHGDPSRPWNYFHIRVKDDDGNRLYHYEGNWRDIFQNWEAMGLSFPAYLAPMIAKFLNASTADGFNPYRINHEGIDWEIPAPHDPWAGIGYWGDHQIVYLNKLLEWLENYAPDALANLTRGDIFTYAEIPYEILPYQNLVKDGKHTIHFNFDRHNQLIERANQFGTDGRLMMAEGAVYRCSFLEKILVPILAKFSNLVIGGGIWMNTQRPEWNDANNAIVGNGLSMVTVYQLYRHLGHCIKLAENMGAEISVSNEVKTWFAEIADALKNRASLSPRGFLDRVGEAFGQYRATVYANGFSGKSALPVADITAFFAAGKEALAETIAQNKRPDGMYHSYNILTLTGDGLEIAPMFLMLEGQTAVLGSGLLDAGEALALVQAMENSGLFNEKLGQFFLYPMKNLRTFVERNTIPEEIAEASPLVTRLLEEGETVVLRDAAGRVRFHDTIQQSADLTRALEKAGIHADERKEMHDIYECVFEHKQFTGRSGIMYKYEGIGCIYWHQNAKFMLSLQEVFTKTRCKALKEAYYRLQDGFGFRKTPAEWGAFPLEPYSHTPYDMPAQQPGMTGQVKEDILTRMAELGIMVDKGVLRFDPALLRESDFIKEAGVFRYVDVKGEKRELALQKGELAFTICQVPVVYRLADAEAATIYLAGAECKRFAAAALDADTTQLLFSRSGAISKAEVTLNPASMV